MKKKQPLKETFKRIGGKLNEFDDDSMKAYGDAVKTAHGDKSDYQHKSHHEGDGVPFDEFMSNIRNYSSSDERDDILTYLTDQIIKNYTDSDLNDLMYEMSMEFEVGPDGSRQ